MKELRARATEVEVRSADGLGVVRPCPRSQHPAVWSARSRMGKRVEHSKVSVAQANWPAAVAALIDIVLQSVSGNNFVGHRMEQKLYPE